MHWVGLARAWELQSRNRTYQDETQRQKAEESERSISELAQLKAANIRAFGGPGSGGGAR